MLDTKTQQDTTQSQDRKGQTHYVELDSKSQPTDKCLCGYIWDRVFISHNGEICQECVDELKRRGQG